ncbi:MAG: hypothetical protein ACI9PP_001114, partial [Halobacteriales archaeon]
VISETCCTAFGWKRISGGHTTTFQVIRVYLTLLKRIIESITDEPAGKLQFDTHAFIMANHRNTPAVV